MDSPPLLQITHLSVGFPAGDNILYAVRGLDLALPKAKITCLVGESGCGKSLTCRAILRLTPENAVLNGQIFFKGQDILRMSGKALGKIRGASIGMIFQEPMTSLNPVLTIGAQTAEPLRWHMGMGKGKAREKVIDLFRQVGIPSPEERYSDYPHQLSGGMRQRVMIAMALACQPSLLLADEPTTALDATIQGQILRLLLQESRAREMGVLLITHDLGVVAEVADLVGVMYAGILAEYAESSALFAAPLHPYTRGLIASAPAKTSMRLERLPTIPGVVPTLGNMPAGCPYHPRCADKMPICESRMPPVFRLEKGHIAACWLYGKP